jgi:hypothetical protein
LSGTDAAPRPRAWPLGLAFGLALVPLLPLPLVGPGLAELSRCGLVWLPWLAVAGLPGEPADARRSWALGLALALPMATLAAWLDGPGVSAREPLPLATLVAGALLFALLAESAHRAARAGLRWYAPTWLLLIFGAPSLAAALEWVTRGELESGGTAWTLASASPLGGIGLALAGRGGFDAVDHWRMLVPAAALLAAASFHGQVVERREA